MSDKKTLKDYFELTRAYALGVTFGSCMIIWAFAHYNENFSWINFIVLVIALCFVHMGANLFDDYIDVKMKLKQGYTLENLSFDSFVPKAGLIRNGTFTFKQVESVLLTLFINAIVIGIYFACFSGWQVLLFMLAGGLLALFYPISPKYGVSEIVIGLIYGPLMIMGGYFALTKSFDMNLLYLSSAIFFSTLVLLHTDNIMDWEFDTKNGKKTICILSKSKKNAINILKFIIFMSYAIVVAGVFFQKLNPFSLYVFLTLPIAAKLIESIQEYVEIKDVQFIPKWYYGMFENWKEIEKNNIAFYMFRFYLARNYLFWFAFFVALGTISAPYSRFFSL